MRQQCFNELFNQALNIINQMHKIVSNYENIFDDKFCSWHWQNLQTFLKSKSQSCYSQNYPRTYC